MKYSARPNTNTAGQATPDATQMKRPTALSIIVPFWTSSEWGSAYLKLALILTISFGGTYLAIWSNQLLGDVTDALVNRRWQQFFDYTLRSTLVGLLNGSMFIISAVLHGMLALQWRAWMTRDLLARWTANGNYYSIEREGLVDNADQRISEDARIFTEKTLNLAVSFFTASVQAATFAYLLWSLSGALSFSIGGIQISIPGYMVLLALVYTGIQLMLTHWVGKTIVGLTNLQQTVEADFRYTAVQLRTNAEQIAFYAGGDRESVRLSDHFEQVRSNALAIIKRTARVMFLQTAYGHVFSPVPTLAALPRYFAGELTVGGLTRVTSAFGMFNNTISLVNQAYTDVAGWFAIANRLCDLYGSIAHAQAQQGGICLARSTQHALTTSALSLHTPGGEPLVHIEPQIFSTHERWLIQGASGVGKSTLLRAAAGLWPHGEGSIQIPETASLMFLPQRSYIPEGSLKAALIYPGDVEQFEDRRCQDVLQTVGLAHQGHSLHTVDHWQQKLSGGEQQRLAVARALLHQPDYLFLDEATSALDEPSEAHVYEALLHALPKSTIISVAHRSALKKFHDHFLTLSSARSIEQTGAAGG